VVLRWVESEGAQRSGGQQLALLLPRDELHAPGLGLAPERALPPGRERSARHARLAQPRGRIHLLGAVADAREDLLNRERAGRDALGLLVVIGDLDKGL
jgi:hypothetical protein